MFSSAFLALFFTLFGTAFVWFGLVFWFLRRMRLRHPEAHQAIGAPTLFWNNSPRSGWLLLKFLFTNSWQTLADPRLHTIARLMQVTMILYTVGFTVLLFMFLFGPSIAN